ncbi:biopolymer transporter ExbD [Cytophagaceae bacterium ABcell3]|nr:biopolymer transporter ExbD [Cytophagaceae bacterium ABcell3]
MPKVKVPRKSISMDMTAMCDVAFLLLTFFMLTTKFKPQEAVAVDIPSSVSEIKLPDTDIMTIAVDKDGGVYFGIDGQKPRAEMLEKMAKKYNIQFSEDEIREFALMPSFGTPVSSLKQVLHERGDARDKLQEGIPVDSMVNELKDWVYHARLVNPKIKIAIKGDKDSDYDMVARVIATLQEQNINKFNLITTMEAKPE